VQSSITWFLSVFCVFRYVHVSVYEYTLQQFSVNQDKLNRDIGQQAGRHSIPANTIDIEK